MMQFGFSRAAHDEFDCRKRSPLVAQSNVLRASTMVRLVLSERAMIRRTFTSFSGRVEAIAFPNPAFVAQISGGYAYPADSVATLQVFAGCLCRSCILTDIAAAQNIDSDGVAWMIESLQGGYDA